MRKKPHKRLYWHKWFAWHPVLIDNVTVWLETIERKRDPDIFDWVYSYRTIEKNKDGRKLWRRLAFWSARTLRR